MKSPTLCALAAAGLLLAACVTSPAFTPYAGPIAAPQVAYRIDSHRYFEVVPLEDMACARARLYYTDTARGIHVNVTGWDRVSKGTLVIDAANDEYLVAPIILSGSSCQTGDAGSDLCAARLFYSQDGGRNWKSTVSLLYGRVHLTGSAAYIGTLSVDVVDISKDNIARPDWVRHSEDGFTIPAPKKAPVDIQPNCSPSNKE
ncbi:MAG: hypothetical protein V4582_20230 [Pseudomonadota bacterium]